MVREGRRLANDDIEFIGDGIRPDTTDHYRIVISDRTEKEYTWSYFIPADVGWEQTFQLRFRRRS